MAESTAGDTVKDQGKDGTKRLHAVAVYCGAAPNFKGKKLYLDSATGEVERWKTDRNVILTILRAWRLFGGPWRRGGVWGGQVWTAWRHGRGSGGKRGQAHGNHA